MNRNALMAVPFFAQCSEDLLEALLLRLHTTYATSGDVIIQVHTVGKEMFILSKGEVEVVSAEGKQLAVLGEGSFFGEIALLSQSKRTVSIMAISNCILYRLDQHDLESVFIQFPHFKHEMELVASSRLLQSKQKSAYTRNSVDVGKVQSNMFMNSAYTTEIDPGKNTTGKSFSKIKVSKLL